MKQTVYQLVKANAEVLRKLTSAGAYIEDYKNIELYEDFCRLTGEGLKTAYVVMHLAPNMSCRSAPFGGLSNDSGGKFPGNTDAL